MMILCLHCAHVFEDAACCPQCHSVVDKSQYGSLLRKAGDYIRFGYDYRKRYEEQFKEKGKIELKFALKESAEIINWIGLAVLSGVIGGASWDLIKLVCRKITEQIRSEEVNEIINDDTKLEEMKSFLLEYHCNFKGVKAEVRDAILEEFMAHEAEKFASEDFIKDLAEDKYKMLNFLKAASAAGARRYKQKISSAAVKNIWDKVK